LVRYATIGVRGRKDSAGASPCKKVGKWNSSLQRWRQGMIGAATKGLAPDHRRNRKLLLLCLFLFPRSPPLPGQVKTLKTPHDERPS